MKKFNLSKLTLAISLALSSLTANAVLERVGPTSTNYGYPLWYQDTTGLSLEFCSPTSQAELAGGYCLLLPGDVTQMPEVFPNAFFDEHFYSAASATMPINGGAKASLTTALEGAFAGGPPKAGDQIVFTRIRVLLNPAPIAGAYRFVHPYGEEIIEALAGERIFFTDDVGLCGSFQCAMQGRYGPFLLPSILPGGPEQAAFADPAIPGKLYIADPTRLGPVTGSPLPDFLGNDGLMHNHNVFRIEGPAGSALGGPGIDFAETNDFSLMGKIYTGQMPGLVSTEKAVYSRTTSEQKVDVSVNAFSTAGSRLPTLPRPAGVAPVVSFYNTQCGTVLNNNGDLIAYTAPTGNANETLMTAQGNLRWGQTFPANNTPIPDSICVKDNSAVDVNGAHVPAYHQLAVKDDITISEALFDATNSTLSVSAASSDKVNPPTLTLAGYGQMTNGSILLGGMTAPPAKVNVISSARGSNSLNVTTSGAPVVVTVVEASNDSVNIVEDSGLVAVPVINGDTLNGTQIDPNITSVTLTIIGNSTKGTVAINNATGAISYTPNPNAFGMDTFTYTTTVNGVASNVATATISIAPINDLPISNNDTIGGAVNTPLTINVLANDTDVDGDALSVAVLTPLTSPFGSTFSASVNANNTIAFTGDGIGAYQFSYRASDGTTQSIQASVLTINLSSPEAVNATLAQYIANKGRWKVTGTTSIAATHTMTLKLTGVVAGNQPCSANGRVIATTNSAAGAFTFDLVGLDPRTTNCNAVRVDSVLGGADLSTPITIK
jgi:Bacterial Ig domain